MATLHTSSEIRKHVRGPHLRYFITSLIIAGGLAIMLLTLFFLLITSVLGL